MRHCHTVHPASRPSADGPALKRCTTPTIRDSKYVSVLEHAGHGQLPSDGDAALRQLYSGHAAALRSYVKRFTAGQVSADDIVQETFIRAWRHLPS